MMWRPTYELLRLIALALLIWISVSLAYTLHEDAIWEFLRRMAEAKGVTR